jgi:hypothetical protein
VAFWADSSHLRDEPKRAYRWLLYMGGIEPYVAKKVTKPGYAISKITDLDIYGKPMYSPSVLEWKDVKATLVDTGTPDLTATFYTMLKNSGWGPPEGDVPIAIEGGKLKKALGRVAIQQIANPKQKGIKSAQVIEEWILYNAWISDIDFGQLDYTSDDLVEINITLTYDYAKLNKDNKSSTVKKDRKIFEITENT